MMYENPFDNFNIAICDSLCPFFKKLDFTPNGLTTVSLILGILSLYFLWKYNMVGFAIFYYLSYLFDCMDGHYARKYQLVSKGGDMYDHIKDVSVNLCLIYIVWSRYKTDNKTTLIALITIIIFFTLMCAHLGCQERIYPKDESGTLNFSRSMCVGNDATKTIKLTRYFGCGTWCITIIVIVIYLNSKRSR